MRISDKLWMLRAGGGRWYMLGWHFHGPFNWGAIALGAAMNRSTVGNCHCGEFWGRQITSISKFYGALLGHTQTMLYGYPLLKGMYNFQENHYQNWQKMNKQDGFVRQTTGAPSNPQSKIMNRSTILFTLVNTINWTYMNKCEKRITPDLNL